MKVLIIRNAYQKDTGGAEQYAFNLALALKEAGHVPFVVTKHAAIRQKCRDAGIATIRGIWHESQEWGRHYYLRKILMPCWYVWLILRHHINVVHPQSRDDFVFATSAASFTRKTCVWTDHADLKYIMDRVGRPHPRMQAWILRASKKAKAIICVSHSELASIMAVAPEFESKLVVVHNGVFPPAHVQDVPKDGLVIGTNARLVPAKGIEELIVAFSNIHKQHPATHLWLLGGFSGNKDLYESKARSLNIADAVRFIGYVPNPNDYVSSMDIFVHASYHEAFSLAVIEACMLGKPVIATAVGGTPEIISNDTTGLLVEPRDPKAIEMALSKLITDVKLRNKLADAAQELAMSEFNFQVIVEEKIIPIYQEPKNI